ncbi:MAG: HNH endonuclease [Chitinophagaceae bacterium]
MNDPTQSRYRYLKFKTDTPYRRYIHVDKQLRQGTLEKNNIEVPPHGSYGPLLFRQEWKSKRAAILARDNGCVICRRQDALQVHHRQYHFVVRHRKFKLPWEYPDYLLITLCESCHKRGHDKFQVPIIHC